MVRTQMTLQAGIEFCLMPLELTLSCDGPEDMSKWSDLVVFVILGDGVYPAWHIVFLPLLPPPLLMPTASNS